MHDSNPKMIIDSTMISYGLGSSMDLVTPEKIAGFFEFFRNNLKQQMHYDFGLRAIKNILNSAAQKKDIGEDCDFLCLIQSILETIPSRLIASDVPVFNRFDFQK